MEGTNDEHTEAQIEAQTEAQIEAQTEEQPAVADPADKPAWRDRVYGVRAVAGVAVAGLIIGGGSGFAIHAATDGGDRDRQGRFGFAPGGGPGSGPGRMGRGFGPGARPGDGPGQGMRNFRDRDQGPGLDQGPDQGSAPGQGQQSDSDSAT